jgi:hypothetical protein
MDDEPLLLGARVEVERADGTLSFVLQVVDGRYRVVNLPADTYTIREIEPPGYHSTTPNEIVIEIPASQQLEINFGNISRLLLHPNNMFLPVVRTR